MPAPALQIQTVYADLLERAADDAFREVFPDEGDFVVKTVKGRRYWYFQHRTAEARVQKYVGPETPELLDRIGRHKRARSGIKQRRTLVSTLTRAFGIPAALPEIGAVIQALAESGVFRLRGVLVGTAAYQTYPAMLGTPLKGSFFQTEDVDIAQFANVSVAVGDRTPPMLDVLRSVDTSFHPVPHRVDGRKVTRYRTDGALSVDFLTPNEGGADEEPRALPALRTDAEPLRFLDFLIHEPQPAVVLHDAGVYVLAPQPQRFAIHKLIVSRRRSAGNPKRDKDVHQAESLLDVLVAKRPFELSEAWREACGRGPKWRQLLLEATAALSARVRELTLKTVGEPRKTLPRSVKRA